MLEVISGIFVAFKLMGFIELSWWICLTPWFIEIVLGVILSIVKDKLEKKMAIRSVGNIIKGYR